MLFNSLEFAWFFPIVCAAYFAIPHRFRPLALLAASCWFYMAWEPRSIILLAGCIAAAYAGALLMDGSGTASGRKAWCAAAAAMVLAALVVFKYANFFIVSANAAAGRLGLPANIPALRLVLPVGISFFTFKALSYLFDVYRRKHAAERDFLAVAVYISFFPQILAGPIERARNFLPQLKETHRFDYNRVAAGLALILWGLFKKAVIADRLAVFVSWVYTTPGDYQGLPLVMATYFYAFQIYCDFSGYSDMAIGAAGIMGFSTMRNFDRPYFSASVAEFWRRWHMSLSSWFRDYLYIPLGGSRVSLFRWAVNVLVVFLVSGLWHGSAWNFVIWGGLHGLYLVAARLAQPALRAFYSVTRLDKHVVLKKAICAAVTFHLVTFAWIFFRASSIADALHIVTHLFAGWRAGVTSLLSVFSIANLVSAALLVTILETAHLIQRRGSGVAWLGRRPPWIRWAVYAAMVLAIINLRPQFQAQFIYLQF